MLKKRTIYDSGRVIFVPIHDIAPNPDQPRQIFEKDALLELRDSIRSYGIIQPLSVRRTCQGYELVSGERRLRAAKLAGLSEVPCIVMDIDRETSGMLAMVENLQRQDLDYIEEARGLERLMTVYGLSQEEAAQRVGKSQPAVANKLRILKHSDRILELLRREGLSERHARALLRIPQEEARFCALQVIAEKKMTVAKAEEYIEGLLKQPEKPKAQTRTWILRDVRLFINSVNNNLKVMQEAGVGARMDRQDTEESIVLTINIPRSPAASRSSEVRS